MGSLFTGHFQVAYVVRSVDDAIQRFAGQFGIAAWDRLDTGKGREQTSASRVIATAYAGELMIELIEPNPHVESIYSSWVPSSKDSVRLHHLGFLAQDEAEFASIVRRFDDNGYGRAYAGSFGDILDFHYADTTATLGHYCEVIFLRPGGHQFFARAPHN